MLKICVDWMMLIPSLPPWLIAYIWHMLRKQSQKDCWNIADFGPKRLIHHPVRKTLITAGDQRPGFFVVGGQSWAAKDWWTHCTSWSC